MKGTMKEITSHRVNPCNKALKIESMDAPGPGGAHHHYRISGLDTTLNPSHQDIPSHFFDIIFQNGPIGSGDSPNGITNEALLAIVIDRLEAFNAGPYKCRENALAITKLEEAVLWLNERTQDRERRGVEGTMQV